jgi:hypothetical protein
MLLAVDRTMDAPDCDDAQSMQPNPNPPPAQIRFDANPQGWEGVRVFDVSDGSARFPGAPFSSITHVDAQYTDCGAHTITANTKFVNTSNPRLIVYASSYPLRPGPTCGQTLQGLPVCPTAWRTTPTRGAWRCTGRISRGRARTTFLTT